jgi:hypothetical protein
MPNAGSVDRSGENLQAFLPIGIGATLLLACMRHQMHVYGSARSSMQQSCS